jgi:acetylornithine/succinyldiaminopimelate/putrescine aminotransferase
MTAQSTTSPIQVADSNAVEAGEDERELFGAYLRPRVLEMMRLVHLDVRYHRAQGDYLYTWDLEDRETKVLDLLGGFGSALFGHNHPALIARARRTLDEGRPFHAQASVRGTAAVLGARLSAMARRATGQEYITTLANSGAEAVEAALKHAGFEHSQRVAAVRQRLRNSVARARITVQRTAISESAIASFVDQVRHCLGRPEIGDLEGALVAIDAQAGEVGKQAPALFAVRRAFHGKTTGALRLTYNARYRAPWPHLGGTIFLPPDDGAALASAAADWSQRIFRVVVHGNGTLELDSEVFHNVLACFAEPIQGEGGVHELGREFLGGLRAACTAGGYPLVLDEIQSGMGRTGTFLASEGDVEGDYYLLSKSLGGALAKVSALLVRRDRYVPDFGLLHTSTFAEDDFSSEVALAALDLLERDDGQVYKMCREKGQHFRMRLEALRARHPGVVAAVRGRGLILGLELQPGPSEGAPFFTILADQDLLGFVLAGYLLSADHIRVAPALSANATIRIEPSAYIAAAEIDRACEALGRVVELLDGGDSGELARFLVRGTCDEFAGQEDVHMSAGGAAR